MFALAGGWGPAAPRDDDDEDDVQGQDAPIVRTWKRYEKFLREEAQRLGMRPPYQLTDGRRLFFGEFASLPAAEQFTYWQAQGPEADDDDE